MYTVVEKIFQRKTGAESRANDIVIVDVDGCMVHDLNGPSVVRNFNKIAETVKNPAHHLVALDHQAPSPNVNVSNNHVLLREFAHKHDIDLVDVMQGVCHQVMMENGKVLPGSIVLGTDSHSCMYGALNAFSTGVGAAEAAVILASGQCWFRIPETIRIEFTGKLPEKVTGKDIILEIIRILGEAGANYKCLEFGGSAMDQLSFDTRTTISNMAIECGAKGAIMPFDEITEQWMKEHDICGGEPVSPDPDAEYCRRIEINLSDLKPLVAVSPDIANVVPAETLESIRVNQVVIGSCTNGRYEDFAAAAEILKGKKLAAGVRLIAIPASLEVQGKMMETGVYQTLLKAGASLFPPNCGPCAGLHCGLLGDGEVTVTTTNRNGAGRMGSKLAKVYVASAVTAAYSALNGFISCEEK